MKPRINHINISNFQPMQNIDCPSCGSTTIKPLDNKMFGFCSNCKSRVYLINFNNIQKQWMRDTGVVILFSGTGTGKTISSAFRLIMDALKYPNFRGAALANTYDQLDRTFKRLAKQFIITKNDKHLDFESDLIKENESRWEFKNGSIIEFLPGDSIGKLKGDEYCGAVLIETETQQIEIPQEILKRIRHPLFYEYELDDKGNIIYQKDENNNLSPIVRKDKHYLILESNFSYYWLVDWILQSRFVYFSKSILWKEYKFNEIDIKPNYNAYIMSAADFPHVSSEYIKQQESSYELKGEVNKYIYGDIFNDSNKVILNVNSTIINDFKLEDYYPPHTWRLFMASDLGVKGATTLSILAINCEEPNKIYYIEEGYWTENTIQENAALMREMINKYRARGFIIKCHKTDRLGNQTLLVDKRTNRDHYAQHGIIMTKSNLNGMHLIYPAINKSIRDGNFKTFTNCRFFLSESNNYEKKWNKITKTYDYPRDNNTQLGLRTRHSIDSVSMAFYEINLKNGEWLKNFYEEKPKVYTIKR